ncbi:MAG: delta-lactam-biosynthetic de-N-acetylase [Peptococcaceae bacterium]|nr:delta-lactam-biosynthetic de-N-acetylase [Peptococcaceae bacterium]
MIYRLFTTPTGSGSNDRLQKLTEEVLALEEENWQLKETIKALKAQNELPPEDNPGLPSDDQNREVWSWYFKPNPSHTPPGTDDRFLKHLQGKGYYLGNPQRKKIYLTFDEGYENGHTKQILDILKNNNVTAAFFVTGDYVRRNPALVQRMVAEGHIVGNHTATHPSLPTLSNEEIKEEIMAVHRAVEDLTGYQMSFLRPPRGEFNSRTLEVAKSLGYDTVFWSMAYQDWDVNRQPGKEAAYRYVANNIHNGAVILLHAVSKSNTEALDDIIHKLKSQGYVFASLEEIRDD